MSLTVEHINKSFAHVHVIKGLSMDEQEGAIFGFLGANGAGKTTTMRMILDILHPDSGSITWNGRDARGAAPELGLSTRGAWTLSKNARG